MRLLLAAAGLAALAAAAPAASADPAFCVITVDSKGVERRTCGPETRFVMDCFWAQLYTPQYEYVVVCTPVNT
jgi:hypothetical protein